MRTWLGVHLTSWLAVVLAVCVMGVLTIPDQAHAITQAQINEHFRCAGGGAGGQGFFTKQACAGDPKNGQVFSYFVCEFENIIVETLAEVYCNIVAEARPAVMAALTMAVLFFGMAILMGITPFTGKELMIMAGKFSLVLAFATQAEYMIGIGYALFMNIAKEGIIIVISHLFQGQNFQNDQDVYRMFDNLLREFMQMVSMEGKDGNKCKNALFALITVMAAALPPLAFIGIYFAIKLLWVILRAIFGYCQGILAVSFLVTLSPIYICFGLFKPTRALFDKWIQYLISFSFQMVIVFAFLGMIFSIARKSADDMKAYTDLVKPYNKESESGGHTTPFGFCGICEINETSPKERPTCKSDKAIDPGKMAGNKELLQFASVKVIAMVILFYILDIMMDFVPQMARSLAGPKYAGQIGGGDTSSSPEVSVALPGENKIDQLIGQAAQKIGQKTGIAGFMRGGSTLGSGTFSGGPKNDDGDKAVLGGSGPSGDDRMLELMRVRAAEAEEYRDKETARKAEEAARKLAADDAERARIAALTAAGLSEAELATHVNDIAARIQQHVSSRGADAAVLPSEIRHVALSAFATLPLDSSQKSLVLDSLKAQAGMFGNMTVQAAIEAIMPGHIV